MEATGVLGLATRDKQFQSVVRWLSDNRRLLVSQQGRPVSDQPRGGKDSRGDFSLGQTPLLVSRFPVTVVRSSTA